ncbi:MAG: hypothetical protein KAT46_00450 [Deltaproteobacteria bacterium]|nr:hypothetical protein [Deltaproteobacteria bacterium]
MNIEKINLKKLVVSLSVFILFSVQLVHAEEQAWVEIYSNGYEEEVPFIVYNSEGIKLGYDPRTEEYFNELGEYGTGGQSCIDCIDDTPHTHEAGFRLQDGDYKIELWGFEPTSFLFEMMIVGKDAPKGFNISGVVDKDKSSTITLTYSSVSRDLWSLTRVATFSSLKQDIELAHKVGWIKNKGITASLLKKASAIEASVERDRSTRSAENQLNALIKEIKAIKSKHIDDKAITMLTEDVEYLLKNL